MLLQRGLVLVLVAAAEVPAVGLSISHVVAFSTLELGPVAASAITANSVPVDVVIYGDANSNGLIGTDGVAAAETSVEGMLVDSLKHAPTSAMKNRSSSCGRP